MLSLVAVRFANGEIAERLDLSPLTARTHVARIRAWLGARDRVQLVVLAYRSRMSAGA